jgi:hypothetical protein
MDAATRRFTVLDQRARDVLRHRPRRHPRGEEIERRRLHLRDRTPEIGYTEQRPHEYAVVLARRCARGSRADLHPGRPRPLTPRAYNSPDRDKEFDGLRALIKEEMSAGFYNIDIDTSTLVDLDKATLDEQQEVNVNLAADFTAFIRTHSHALRCRWGRDRRGRRQEFRRSRTARLHEGFNAALATRGKGLVGLSKISVQTARRGASSTPTARCGWT